MATLNSQGPLYSHSLNLYRNAIALQQQFSRNGMSNNNDKEKRVTLLGKITVVNLKY